MDISKERFYGAKSEPVDALHVVREAAADTYRWQIARVEHGGTHDHYQLLIDDTADQLATEPGAQAYLEHVAEFGEVHGEIGGSSARPMGAEQSNTNLVVDNEYVLKVFRKLEPGLNPDVELLTEIADCPHVAGVRGYLTGQINGEDHTLAMMQQLIPGGTDGFDLALDSPDFVELSRELGEATRRVHRELASHFPTQRVGTQEVVDKLHEHLDELLPQAPQLEQHEEAIRALYDGLAGGDVDIQRVHGDLHLGQTLRTPDTWYLIDFEGEPARPLAQRVLPDHVMRDVAGMVRSYGYAAAMAHHGDEWERRNVDAFLEGYGADDRSLLSAYVVDKAAYEVVYEANNRPGYVDIPLQAITRLLG